MTTEKVSVQKIIDSLHTQANRPTTDDQKVQLYELGTSVAKGIQTENPNFNANDFLKACSIDTNWGKLQRAA